MSYRFITVVGNVGSGKSTLSDLLAEALPAERVPADSLYTVNPFFPLALEDRARWSLTSDLWFLHERVKMTRQIPPILERSHVVVDSGLPMSYVYAHSRVKSGFFTADEWQLYQRFHDELVGEVCKPNILIYLQAPVPFLRQRIEKRGREFEIKFHQPAYLESLNTSLEAMIIAAESADVKVIRIRADQAHLLENPFELTDLVAKLLG